MTLRKIKTIKDKANWNSKRQQSKETAAIEKIRQELIRTRKQRSEGENKRQRKDGQRTLP